MQKLTTGTDRHIQAASRGWLRGALFVLCIGLPQLAPAQVRLPEPGIPFVELEAPSMPELLSVTGEDGLALLRQSIDAGQWPDALAIARVTADSAVGQSAEAGAAALHNLAVVQLLDGRPDLAAEHFNQALDLLTSTSRDRRDPRRVSLLYGLGMAAFQQQRYADAEDFFAQSQFVARASLGLQSSQQLAPLAALSETQLALGRYDEAVARASAQLAITNQNHGAGSEAALIQAQRSARVYGRVGQYAAKRRLLRQKLDDIREAYGLKDWRQVAILREVARTYREQYLPEIYGLTDLELAIEIAEQQPEHFTTVEKAGLQLDLGDYYMTFRSPGRAHKIYAKAYALLAEAGESATLKQWFGQPQVLFIPQPAPLDDVGSFPAAGLPEGHVRFSMGISLQGKTLSPQTIEILPAEAAGMRLRAERAVREARFRPQITAKGPVPARDFEYSVRFRYLPEQPGSDDQTLAGSTP